MTSLASTMLANLARRRMRGVAPSVQSEAQGNQASYMQWRDAELRRQFTDNFSLDSIRGKDVLDFGCGSGELMFFLSENGARSVHGIDLNPQQINLARQNAKARGVSAQFHHGQRSDKIDLPDQMADVMLCFDCVEHILDYETVIPEWRRVLRPGGRVFVWWQPWLHPYGHHLHTYLPLPWVHAVFSERELIRACAQIVESPEFNAPHWDLDADGNKLKRFTGTKIGHLNHLTISEFERLCRKVGYAFARREQHVVSGAKSLPFSSLFKLPVLREFFTAFMIYEIDVRAG